MCGSPQHTENLSKNKINVMPKTNFGCCAVARTRASPTIPMVKPAARPDKPTAKPEPRWMRLAKKDLVITALIRNKYRDDETVDRDDAGHENWHKTCKGKIIGLGDFLGYI